MSCDTAYNVPERLQLKHMIFAGIGDNGDIVGVLGCVALSLP